MGGTSNVIYSMLYPNDIFATVALGAVSDLTSYYHWCRTQNDPEVLTEIADHIRMSYRGDPDEQPAKFRAHSALVNTDSLKVPLFLAHGESDQLIPVEQSRALARRPKLSEKLHLSRDRQRRSRLSTFHERSIHLAGRLS